MVDALERLGADEACILFYSEHIEADAVHELVLRHDVVGYLLEQDPGCARDISFGAQAIEFLEGRLGSHLLGSWSAGRTSLLTSAGTPA